MPAVCSISQRKSLLVAVLVTLSIGSARNTVRATGFATETTKLTASDILDGDFFGWLVDIDDGTAIVGNFPLAPGAAYLYDTQSFVETKLSPPGGVTADDVFGSVVSIGGGRALVGAPGFPGTGLAGGIYAYDVATGALDAGLGKITPADSANNDEFGFDLGQDGTNAMVGAPVGGTGQGKAYLFDAVTGLQNGSSFSASDGFAADNFGYSVDISGDWALVGAPVNVDQISNQPGAAYVYDLANGRQETKLSPPACPVETPTCHDGNEFGWSVAIDGTRAVIGAPDRGQGQGRAYIFNDITSPGSPIELTPPTSLNQDDFGYAVDILGNVVIVGAPANENGAEPNNRAYVYSAATGDLLEEIVKSDGAGDDEYGFSVGLWNNLALIGAPLHDANNDPNTGGAYLFRPRSSWGYRFGS